MNNKLCVYVAGVTMLAALVPACASSTDSEPAPAAQSSGGPSAEANPVSEVREATEAQETREAMRALTLRGWEPSGVAPRVERGERGRWAVAFSMQRAGEAPIDLVYSAEPKPAAVIRADDSVRPALTADRAPVVRTESVGVCTPGCDAPASACVEWSCTYVSSMGLSFGCLTFGNPLGVYHVVSYRDGHTDPSQCALPYLDIHGVVHSCPAPSTAMNLFVCGWA